MKYVLNNKRLHKKISKNYCNLHKVRYTKAVK